MPQLGYIGSSLPALAFSLLGARCYAPPQTAAGVAAAFDAARRECGLVLVETAYAALAQAHIDAALAAAPAPPALVVPPLHEEAAFDDRTLREARQVLGVG